MRIPSFPLIFFFFLVSLFLIPCVFAIQINGATFTDSVTPGEIYTHTIDIRAENVNETGKVFDISVAGDFVNVDKTSVKLSDTPQEVIATIRIPTDATNGNYTSAVMFTAEEKSSSMTKIALRVPVHIVITGGKEVTPAPGAILQAPEEVTTTEEITNVQTQEPTQKMGQDSIKTPAPVTTTETTQAPQETPTRADIPIWAFVVVGLGVVGIIVLGVVLYSERRG
jgi:hypothetical protein